MLAPRSVSFLLPRQRRQALDVRLHPLGAVLPHLLCDVGIYVHREGHGGMPEVFRNGLDVVPGPDGRHRIGVPEIVEVHVQKADGFHSAFKNR